MKIGFFGSDDFAQHHLIGLLEAGYNVVGCVTQPDRARGRGMKVTYSPIKETALENQIPVLQPESWKDDDAKAALKEWGCDVFIVIAYGRILPADVLGIPKIGCFNVHGSVLPKYRGAAPINWAILDGERETGLTIIKMNPVMDGGDVVSVSNVSIEEDVNAAELRTIMMEAGKELLIKTIAEIQDENFDCCCQNAEEITFAKKLTKELGFIDWNQNAKIIHNQVRGLIPWPCAQTSYNGKKLKVLKAAVACGDFGKAEAGTVALVDSDGIIVGTGEGFLRMCQIRPESGKAMDGQSFANGYGLKIGDRFEKIVE